MRTLPGIRQTVSALGAQIDRVRLYRRLTHYAETGIRPALVRRNLGLLD